MDGIILTGGPNLFELKEFESKGLMYYRVDWKSKKFKYLELVESILKKTKEINDEERPFLIFGICLGH